VILPILLHYVILCFVSIPFPRYPFPRHLLPAIPLFVLVATYGVAPWAERIQSAGKKGFLRKAVAFFMVYQLIFVGQIEYYFVFDTFTAAEKWIAANIPPSTKIAAFCWERKDLQIPNDAKRLSPGSSKRQVLFLCESSFVRYQRSAINLFKKFPAWEETYHGKYFQYIFIQALFRGRLPYVLVKKFEMRTVTPEMFLFKKIWGSFPLFVGKIGDVLIYEKLPAAGPPQTLGPAHSLPEKGSDGDNT